MASSPLPLLFLTLSLVSVSAFARPCKTFFFFTTIPSTTTTTPQEHIFSSFNVVPFQTYPSNSPKFFTFFFNPINNPQDLPNQPSVFPFKSNPADYFSLRLYPFPRFIINDEETSKSQDRSFMPTGLYHPRSSIGNRMKDIMSVVGALLFGVGCGAFTAATMYFVWSLFSPDRFELEDESDSDGSDIGDDDDFSSKKQVGYVIIPDDDIDAIKKAAQANFKAEAADV